MQREFPIRSVLFQPKEQGLKNSDFIIAIGGDGTILHIAQDAVRYDVPVLGINAGRVGFLATIEREETELIAKIASGDYQIENRMLIEASVGTENCWAVNSKASEADIKATLDFLYWVVTSEEGTAMMAEQFGPIPFKAAKASSNVFFNDANAYIADGNYVVTWAFNYTPNVDAWRAGVVDAMMQYCAGGSWDNVVDAFVQGWAVQYANANE